MQSLTTVAPYWFSRSLCTTIPAKSSDNPPEIQFQVHSFSYTPNLYSGCGCVGFSFALINTVFWYYEKKVHTCIPNSEINLEKCPKGHNFYFISFRKFFLQSASKISIPIGFFCRFLWRAMKGSPVPRRRMLTGQ